MKLVVPKRTIANVTAIFLFSASTLGLTGCGQSRGFSTVNSSASNASSSTGSTATDLWTPAVNAMSGTVSGGSYDALSIVSISQASETLTIKLPLPVNPLGASLGSTSVPQLPGASVSVVQDTSTLQWYLEFSIPLQDLVKGVNLGKATTLPNGSALPGVPGGELPEVSAQLQTKNFNMYFYSSVQYFAIFVPTPGFNPYVSLTWPIKNSAATKIVGYVGTVAQQSTNAGGIYLSLVFPTELQILLDDLFPK